jgi:hypothetical protein
MKQTERQKFITKQLEIIYDEYSTYVYQLIALKPFLNDIIEVSKGKKPVFDLSEIIKKNSFHAKINK